VSITDYVKVLKGFPDFVDNFPDFFPNFLTILPEFMHIYIPTQKVVDLIIRPR